MLTPQIVTLYILLMPLLAVTATGQAIRTGSQIAGLVGQTTHPASAEGSFQQRLKKVYALSQAGHMDEAAAELEKLRQEQPRNFEVNELLGLVEASQGQNEKAVKQLRAAMALAPRSAAAHDNLAAALARMGDLAAAETEWQRALTFQPTDVTANRDLARLYLRQDKLSAALPLLKAAHEADPEHADGTYDLALGDLLAGRTAESRVLVTQLLSNKNIGEYHSLLGKINEKEEKYVEAANEFAIAAELDPSEDNLFLWGSEFLLHRAYEQSIAVFQQGAQRYPISPRLWVGLGMALYSRGEYEPSIKALLAATDLNAEDPRCYLFLSKAYLSAPSQADEVIERFRRYATLQPNNARARFYYALSLWKGKRADEAGIDTKAIEENLLHSLALDDTDAEAHLQLGVFYSDEHLYDKAQTQYERALQRDPQLADAHFRLGRAYLKAGQKAKAQLEFDQFKSLQAQHQAQIDRERAEVKQFVIATKASTVSPAITQP